MTFFLQCTVEYTDLFTVRPIDIFEAVEQIYRIINTTEVRSEKTK